MSRRLRFTLVFSISLIVALGAWIWHRERLDLGLAEGFVAEVLRVDTSSRQTRELMWDEARVRFANMRGLAPESLASSLGRFAESDPLGQPRRKRNGALAEIILQHWTAALGCARESAAEHASFASHDFVGKIAFALGEPERAREAFTAALQQSDGTAFAHAATQVRLAELESSAGHMDLARSLLAQALGVLDYSTDDADPALGLALDLALKCGCENAEALAQRRLQQLEKLGSLESPDAIESLNAIARGRLAAGRDEEATVLLERAVGIARHHTSSTSAGVSLGELGEMRRLAKQLPEAERVLMEGMAMLESARDFDALALSRLLRSLGATQRDLGRNAEAVQHLERALRIQQSQGKLLVDEPEHAELLDVLGGVYFNLRRHEEAAAATQRAFDILQEKALIDTPARCKVAAHLGVILMETNRPEEAEPYLRRANAVVTKYRAAVDPDLSLALATWMAQCLAQQGLTEEAAEFYRQLEPADR